MFATATARITKIVNPTVKPIVLDEPEDGSFHADHLPSCQGRRKPGPRVPRLPIIGHEIPSAVLHREAVHRGTHDHLSVRCETRPVQGQSQL